MLLLSLCGCVETEEILVATGGTFTLEKQLPIKASTIEFSPDGRSILVVDGTPCASLYDIASGERVKRFPDPGVGGDWNVQAATFSPDGKSVATAGYRSYEFSYSYPPWTKPVEIWDVATGRRLKKLRHNQDMGDIYTIAFSADAKRIALGGEFSSVLVWDIKKEEILANIQVDRMYIGESVAFNLAGDRVLTSAGELIDFENNIVEWAHIGVGSRRTCYSPDGRYMAGVGRLGSEPYIGVADATTGEKIGALRDGKHAAPDLQDLAISPDSRTMVVGRSDGSVSAYRLEDGALIANFLLDDNWIADIDFSNDGNRIAVLSSKRIHILNLQQP